ncbi:MAG: alpha/beta hydrolase [Bacteroidota bacterium]|nr:alpha/beta hydrolase [Bacteroidota bacterium]
MAKCFFLPLVYIILTLSAFAQKEIPYGSNSKAGHYVHVNDIQLYYEVYGKGEALLLMHGNSGSIASFSKFIPFLSKQFKVIAVDSRAQGRSSDSNKELTFELMASDMKELLDQLHLDGVYAVGWSDGGIVGLQLAYAYPHKISKLVAIGANFVADSTALSPDNFDTTKIRWYHNLDSSEQKNIISQSHFPECAPLIFDKLINLDLKYPNFTIEQLASIKTPTLVVAGDHDIIIDTHTLKLFHALPHSQLFIVPGSPHHVPIAKPKLLSDVVVDFLIR